MCGIAGLIELSGRPAEARLAKAMADAMAHRGPDGSGLIADGPAVLAHRRLAIIDPMGGAQPMQDGPVVLAFNGEIYNYREIRADLAGERFETESDTEVLLKAYGRWGLDCLDRLRGMFAFALWDGGRRCLHLVRDRLGIKPLYWAKVADRVVFASEFQALLRVPGLARDIDADALAGYLTHQYVPTPSTIYAGIAKLKPGGIVTVHADGRIAERVYWRLDPQVRPRAEAEALAELDALLDETVHLYVRSDVRFGAFLSGGVDSSTVVGYMGAHLGQPVETFTIGFAEEKHSEAIYAAEAAARLGTRHHCDMVDAAMAEAALPLLARRYGEPFGDSSAVPTYFVSRFAAASVKMVLSGDGGDEVFGGYELYRIAEQRGGLAASGPGRALARVLARFAGSDDLRARRQFQAMPLQALFDAGRRIFAPEVVDALAARPHRYRRPPLSTPWAADGASAMQRHDLDGYMLDDILTKVDRASMASSLEVRVPLLDHRVVEFGFGLPTALRLPRRAGQVVAKHLLKRAGERFLDPGFLARPKMGFGIPVAEWLLGPLNRFLRERLLGAGDGLWDLLRRPAVEDMVRRFEDSGGTAVAPSQIWVLLMLALWHDEVHAGAGDA